MLPTLPDPVPDAAGLSAQREYERRSARERHSKEKAVADDAAWRAELIERRPVIGRVRASIVKKPTVGPESQATTAWKVGAEGERRVAEILASCPGVESLHDLAVPRSRANIDHIAVAPAGIFVIDAKKYVGAVEVRDAGTWLRADMRLIVGGRNRTQLTDSVRKQIEVVKASLADSEHADVQIYGVLCFVGAEWPLILRKPVTVNGVTAVWPDGLPSILRPKRESMTTDVPAVAHHLRSAFRPA